MKKDGGPESPNKIDAIDALLLGIGALLDQPAPAAQTIYDNPQCDPASAWL